MTQRNWSFPIQNKIYLFFCWQHFCQLMQVNTIFFQENMLLALEYFVNLEIFYIKKNLKDIRSLQQPAYEYLYALMSLTNTMLITFECKSLHTLTFKSNKINNATFTESKKFLDISERDVNMLLLIL